MTAPLKSTTAYKANIVAEHISTQYRRLRDGHDRNEATRPLMVSMQGPQGAGESPCTKTELVTSLWNREEYIGGSLNSDPGIGTVRAESLCLIPGWCVRFLSFPLGKGVCQ